ncbi:hypothetical protein KOR42_47690 [Thalassoglobus neptunius]|uniref:Uncharacterized protein n=1 Tax=Thalassoglobus neptunius TaxID=1938619 RepID=A0A5C5VSB0_9PLAN|nr:hypothetical protein [Thalassoglobus neptunius]TWT41498.1 hypothetical protein KOR42_47690 [Thalassoglobus neptunius]
MSERRSLLDALTNDDAKLAFINSGKSEPLQPETEGSAAIDVQAQVAPKPKPEIKVETEPEAEQVVAKVRKQKPPRTIPPKKTQSRGETTEPERKGLTHAVVSITTRFKQETAEALRRASLERKLEGLSLSTQQEIVETAVSAWLEREGYLSA